MDYAMPIYSNTLKVTELAFISNWLLHLDWEGDHHTGSKGSYIPYKSYLNDYIISLFLHCTKPPSVRHFSMVSNLRILGQKIERSGLI